MRNYHDEELCTVISEKGQHLLITPNGERISGIIFTRVHDDYREIPTCIVKLMVNIKDTEPKL